MKDWKLLEIKENFEKSNKYALYCDYNDIKYLIELIEQQQTEIEKLNTELQIRIKWQQYFEKEYINKDKIREEIEHCNNELEHIKNGEEFEDEEPMYYWAKVVLQKLLGE